MVNYTSNNFKVTQEFTDQTLILYLAYSLSAELQGQPVFEVPVGKSRL